LKLGVSRLNGPLFVLVKAVAVLAYRRFMKKNCLLSTKIAT